MRRDMLKELPLINLQKDEFYFQKSSSKLQLKTLQRLPEKLICLQRLSKKTDMLSDFLIKNFNKVFLTR